MARRCGAQLAPRYPRHPDDLHFHPWNNDSKQRGVRAPLRAIELHRVRGELRGFCRIPVTAASRPPAILSSAAYGAG
jgi:hypothetical protein